MSKRPFCHFKQVDFDMSIMTRVVFFTSRVWTIWLVILTSQIFAHMKKNCGREEVGR